MTDHFVSINQGLDGFTPSDLTTGTSTSGGQIELRVADGASLSRKDVVIALEAFERFIEDISRSGAFDLNP